MAPRVDPSSCAATDRCPRCGGGFHCGSQDSMACACCSLQLSDGLLAALRARYTGCLCLSCLKALAAGAPLEPPAA